MNSDILTSTVYQPSEDVVSRDVMGELIIVPLVSGIGDMEDEIYTLNDTGKAVWEKMDGKKSIKEIAESLAEDFDAPAADIERDVQGLIGELVRRKIVVPV